MPRALMLGWVTAFVLAGPVLAAAGQQAWRVDLAGEWRFATGDDPRRGEPGCDDSEWDEIQAPALWDQFGYADYDGYGWYRRTFPAPASARAVPLVMEIGGVDDDDWVYINGRLIGEGKGCYQRRLYHVRPGVVQAGGNIIAVRIFDGGMGGGLAVGPITLREEALSDRIEVTSCRLEPPSLGQAEMSLLVELTNKTPREQSAVVEARLTDYLQRSLGETKAQLRLAPGAVLTQRFPFHGGACTDYRLVLALTQGTDRWETLRYLQADALVGARKTWLLSGTWGFLPTQDLRYPPQGAWAEMTVPHAQWGGWPGTEHSAWFRRQFRLPAELSPPRLRLLFQAVAYYCEVYVNGQRVGQHLGGFEPFWVDITTAARPGSDNELLVGVTDWTAGLKAGTPVPDDPEKLPDQSMLIPYGSRPQALRGIWQDVYLVAHGPVAVEAAYVTTSVRRGELSVRLSVRNHGDEPKTVDLLPTVYDAGKPVFALEERPITVPARETVAAEWRRRWTDAKLWWPQAPHLYYLRTNVRTDGTTTDVHDTRFGFREFWVDGKDYRLNGLIFRLRGLVCAPLSNSREAIHDYFTSGMARTNFTLVRNHMGPRPAYYYDIADEVGMCLKDETAFYCAASSYALNDQEFWLNMAAHIDGMVRRSWSHPSVCVWSTENEILHCGGIRTPGTDARIYELGKRMAALDPTRPIEYEGDGDVVGRADTVNIHYPREFGCHDHNLWPNDAWWLGKEGNDRWPQDLVWKGDKPLVLGEFCYYPYSRPPGGVSIFVGDRAYESREVERAAHALGVRFICEGARWSGVTGLNPWVGEAIYGERCLAPITVIMREWDHAFWAGERVPRHLLVLNDTLDEQRLELVVAVMDGEKALDRWSGFRTLAPGGRWELAVNVRMPKQPGRYRLVAKVMRGAEVVYAEERPLLVAVQAPLSVPGSLKVGIFDPLKRSANWLSGAGLSARPVAELSAESLRNVGLLIIGQEAWSADRSVGRECLPAFVAAGGKVLVLAQSVLPDWLPCAVQVDRGRAATMSYPRHPGHPLLEGIALDGRDLCWWRGDHLVSRGLLRKPQAGNFRIITEAGGRGGLLWSPLLELPSGRGCWLLCQYLADEKLGAEPVAQRLLQNMLSYAATYPPPAEVRAVVLASPPFAGYLASLGLAADRLAGKVNAEQLAQHNLLIADTAPLTTENAAALRAFVERGGTLWLHCSEAANEEAVRLVAPGFQRFAKAATRGRATKRLHNGLAAGLSNSDLFWYREDCWYEDWEGSGTGLVDEPCATQLVLDKSALAYTRPVGLAELSVGKGKMVLDSLRLAEAAPGASEKARRIGSILLTNLGAELGHHESPQAYQQEPINLRPHFTTGLRDEVENDGKGGWTDQGPNDMRSLPTGRRVLAGVAFDIADGCIALRSSSHLQLRPAGVEGIPVGTRCDVLFFLHAAAWASADGKTIATCRLRYEDGQELEIAMVEGVNVADWWQPQELPLAQVAWRGANPVHDPVALFCHTWHNPRPNVPIATLSVASADTDAVYLLVALSRGNRP